MKLSDAGGIAFTAARNAPAILTQAVWRHSSRCPGHCCYPEYSSFTAVAIAVRYRDHVWKKQRALKPDQRFESLYQIQFRTCLFACRRATWRLGNCPASYQAAALPTFSKVCRLPTGRNSAVLSFFYLWIQPGRQARPTDTCLSSHIDMTCQRSCGRLEIKPIRCPS